MKNQPNCCDAKRLSKYTLHSLAFSCTFGFFTVAAAQIHNDPIFTNSIDSDRDGIPNLSEGKADADGDGIPNYLDRDSDADGIPDAIEGAADSDNDGTPNYLDTDSDNDGIVDDMEAIVTGYDTNADGIPDTCKPIAQRRIPNAASTNTVVASVKIAISCADNDGDGIDNRFDVDQVGGTDTNRNGVSDSIEKQGMLDNDDDNTPDIWDQDSDNDGIADAVEGTGDPEGDGIPNYLDTDSDNDGIDDRTEAQRDNTSVGNSASQNAGFLNDATAGPTLPDSDGDGIPDVYDFDSDDDGIPDTLEPGNHDSDTIPDYLDTDSDNDGITDREESSGDTTDTDQDGVYDRYDADHADSADLNLDDVNDGVDAAVIGDADGDGTPNFLDTDSDNDGYPDAAEGTRDANGNSLPDYLDFELTNDATEDFDNDGIADLIELATDADHDGLANLNDLDSDNDGISDAVETAADFDGDGVANYLDLDSDGDGLADIIETNGIDSNVDGIVDDFLDKNLDGIDDGAAAIPAQLIDTDSDGSPDYLDLDADNDGYLDVIEGGGKDANNDGKIDQPTLNPALDQDNDTIPDFQQAHKPSDVTSGCSLTNGRHADGFLLTILLLCVSILYRRKHKSVE